MDETTSAAEWRKLADDDPDALYAPWFRAMADLQAAIDQNELDSSYGLECAEQARQLRGRLTAALDRLDAVARVVDRKAYYLY